MRNFIFLLLVFCIPFRSLAEDKSSIKIEVGEKWWGALTHEGYIMPFESNTRVFNLFEEPTNQAAPLLVSSKGRYIWSNKPFIFQITDNEIKFQSDINDVTLVNAGTSLKDAYLAASKSHFQPDGDLPDKLFFSAPQYNTWIELVFNQNQADILKYAHNIIKNNYPPGVLMIDDNWQKYYGNYEFKPDLFPDPKAMVDELHRLGFKVMLWICPLITPDSPEYRDLRRKEYLVKRKDGSLPAPIDWWNGISACLDLTNPDAFEYIKNILKQMQEEYGIDGFKFDAGDVKHYLGDVSFYDSNAIAVDQTKKWSELGLFFPFNEYRASWQMGGKALVQRLRDKRATWSDVETLIPNMLASGLLGYSYTCPDMIGGGSAGSSRNNERPIDQEMFVRSCQIHALMPMMQFSAAPWRILSEENSAICRKAAELHLQMSDYIMQLAKEASSTGEPIVRHLEYEFPHQGFENCIDQFMLGNKYLVTPMVKSGNSRKVVLPKGNWKDELGKKWKGGQTIEISVPLDRLPYFEQL